MEAQETRSGLSAQGGFAAVGNHATRGKLAAFLGLTFVLSAGVYALMFSAGAYDAAGGVYVLLLMWSPGVAAMIVQLAFERRLSGLGWRLPDRRYLLMAYVVPLAYTALAYLVLWVAGWGKGSLQAAAAAASARTGLTPASPTFFALVYLLITGTVGLFGGLLTALGEEIGWRGLLVPELAKRLPFTQVSLASGTIWLLWHLPAMLIGYSGDTPVWYSLLWFAVLVIGTSFLYAWLRLRSASLWPAAVLHAAHNLFVQVVFAGLTESTPQTPYFAGEFGALVPLAAVAVVWLVISRSSVPARP